MKLTLSIQMDNAAFSEDWALEASRILQDCARKLEHGHDEGPLVDLNGNKVGYFRKIGKPSKRS